MSWPKLSETLTHPVALDTCQACGGKEASKVHRWQEHNEQDKPENKLVMLCDGCARRIIEPHPRLYRRLDKFAPWPGAMPICVDCKFQYGTTCRNPSAKSNGGPGVALTMPEPSRAMVDGPKYSGPMFFYHGPVTACAGHQPIVEETINNKRESKKYGE